MLVRSGVGLAVLPFSTAGVREDAARLDDLALVYEDHGRRLKSLAYNLLGNEQDAEDAIQDAFLKAHRARAGFAQRASLHTWVYRVLINTCLDAGRKRRRNMLVGSGPSELEVAGRGAPVDLRLALKRALAGLESRQRAVFLMASVEGMAHAEIAEVMEISETNSRTLLFEARQKLKAGL